MMNKSAYYRQQARTFLQGNWKTFVLVHLIYAIISIAVSSTGVGAIATIVITGPFSLSLVMMELAILSKKDIEIKNMFSGFENFGSALILSLHQGIIIFLWSLLFFIPGILKSLSYSMTYYILAENPEISSKDAMKESAELMKGHRWEYFKLNLSFFGWFIVSVLTLGIYTLWLIPYMGVSTAAFYEDLKVQKYGTANPYGNEPETIQQTPVAEVSNDIDAILGQIQYNEQPADTSASEIYFDDSTDA